MRILLLITYLFACCRRCYQCYFAVSPILFSSFFSLLPYICIVHRLVGLRLRALLCIVVVHWRHYLCLSDVHSLACTIKSCALALHTLLLLHHLILSYDVCLSHFALSFNCTLFFFSFCFICTH